MAVLLVHGMRHPFQFQSQMPEKLEEEKVEEQWPEFGFAMVSR